MAKSPIKLKSSSKAKLKVTKSPSSHNDQSHLILDQSKLLSSVHTIPIKQSPKCHRNFKSNFSTESINYAKSQAYNNLVLRTGSPTGKQSIGRNLQFSQHMTGSQSFHQMIASQPPPSQQILASPQKSILTNSIVQHQSIVHIMSPTKSALDNDRSFIRVVELGKKNPPNETVRPRMISPPRVIHQVHQVKQVQLGQQVHFQASPRQIELERKVKILQMRINELYTQKNQVQTQMNEVNIRLQYENNFLKQKLNTYTSKQGTQKVVTLERRVSCQQRLSMNQSNNVAGSLSQQTSQRLIKQLEKSQQNEYHQSKQIHSLRQQLLQTEQMLSKQINKSLSLLEELTFKQKQNQDMKDELKVLRQKLMKVQKQFKDVQFRNQQTSMNKERQVLQSLNSKISQFECQKISLQLVIRQLQNELNIVKQQNSQLASQIQTLRNQGQQMNITKQLMSELQQNNQLLISAIRSLQSSLKQNEKQMNNLNLQKQQLQSIVQNLESQMQKRNKLWEDKDSSYQRQIQQLAGKLLDIETELIQRNSQIQNLTLSIQAKNNCLQNKQHELQDKQVLIKSQQNKIQALLKSQQQQGNSSTANSFYKKSSNDPCTKCDDLRKTIIKLNSHLNKSTTSIPDSKKYIQNKC